MKRPHLVLLCCAGGLAFSASSLAATTRPFNLELRTGIEYDSNVSVEQADIITRRGDAAFTIGLSAKYRLKPFKNTEITTAYDFDQSLYEDLTDYNLQMHVGSLGLARKIGKINLGTDYRFFHLRLGGDPFLDMHLLNPSISATVGQNIFWRASYAYVRKDFSTAPRLDSNTHQADISAYYFFNQRRAYLNFIARYERENAIDRAFSYDGYNINARLQWPLDKLIKNGKLRLGLAYRERDYRFITPSIGKARAEKRYSVSASADIPLGHGLKLRPEYRGTDRNSNYIFTNYADYVTSLSLIYNY